MQNSPTTQTEPTSKKGRPRLDGTPNGSPKKADLKPVQFLMEEDKFVAFKVYCVQNRLNMSELLREFAESLTAGQPASS